MGVFWESHLLNWVLQIDPTEVWEILKKETGGKGDEDSQRHFVWCWNNQDWDEWRFQGNLGFGGKIYRENRRDHKGRYGPCLRVDCYTENRTPEKEKVIERVNTALRILLVNARLVEPD